MTYIGSDGIAECEIVIRVGRDVCVGAKQACKRRIHCHISCIVSTIDQFHIGDGGFVCRELVEVNIRGTTKEGVVFNECWIGCSISFHNAILTRCYIRHINDVVLDVWSGTESDQNPFHTGLGGSCPRDDRIIINFHRNGTAGIDTNSFATVPSINYVIINKDGSCRSIHNAFGKCGRRVSSREDSISSDCHIANVSRKGVNARTCRSTINRTARCVQSVCGRGGIGPIDSRSSIACTRGATTATEKGGIRQSNRRICAI